MRIIMKNISFTQARYENRSKTFMGYENHTINIKKVRNQSHLNRKQLRKLSFYEFPVSNDKMGPKRRGYARICVS